MQRTIESLGELRTVELVGVGADGRPLVDTGAGRRAAECVWTPWRPDWSASVGRRVLVGALDGDRERPIVVGWIDAPVLIAGAGPGADSGQARTLEFASSDELVLRCGQAKIALRKDGRVEILGGYVLSRSTGPNKIKGASVDIN